LANVVPEKFVELYAPASGVAISPGPRVRKLVLRRASVVVEAIVVSLPVLPASSHARITVSTNIAAGSAAVAGAFSDTAAGSKPKNSLTESKRPKFAELEPLTLTTNARLMRSANIVRREDVEWGLDIFFTTNGNLVKRKPVTAAWDVGRSPEGARKNPGIHQ
jgi:hypothetical protein